SQRGGIRHVGLCRASQARAGREIGPDRAGAIVNLEELGGGIGGGGTVAFAETRGAAGFGRLSEAAVSLVVSRRRCAICCGRSEAVGIAQGNAKAARDLHGRGGETEVERQRERIADLEGNRGKVCPEVALCVVRGEIERAVFYREVGGRAGDIPR